MSEFLALLAIESHRTAAQHIEVAGSKGNTLQTFANIVAVDLAWKKRKTNKQSVLSGLTAVIIQKFVLILFHFARARDVAQRKP